MVVIVDSRGIYAKKKIFQRLFKKNRGSCRSISVTPTESPPRGHGGFLMTNSYDPNVRFILVVNGERLPEPYRTRQCAESIGGYIENGRSITRGEAKGDFYPPTVWSVIEERCVWVEV